METELLHWLASNNGYYVYWGVFILLILGGLWFPIPEDIPVLLGGVAASKGIVLLPGIIFTSYLGVMIADYLVFLLGYFLGERLLLFLKRSALFPYITEAKIEGVRRGLRRKQLSYILIGRLFFPVRSLTFVTAGSLRIPFQEFLACDALCSVLSVSLVTGIGYYAGSRITPEAANILVHNANCYLVWLFIACLGFYLLLKGSKLLLKRKQDEEGRQYLPN